MPIYLLVVRTPEILSQGDGNGKFFNLFMRITVYKSSRTGQHTHTLTHIGIDVNTHYVEMYALAYVHAYTHTHMYNGIESSRQSH